MGKGSGSTTSYYLPEPTGLPWTGISTRAESRTSRSISIPFHSRSFPNWPAWASWVASSTPRLNWLGQPSGVGARVAVQIRHRAAPAAAEIIRVTADEVELALDEPVSAITPGQSVGIYDRDRMLGGGVIESARGQKLELPVLAA